MEGCLNSRPLCPLTDATDSLDVLSPNHFLTGKQWIAVPECDFTRQSQGLLTRWQIITKVYQDICVRYKREYLSRLLNRPKWHNQSRNLEIGQLVLMREDGLAPTEWPLGRVTAVHPGDDGVVRVVTVRSRTGEKKRSIGRLYPLPMDEVIRGNDLVSTGHN